MDQTKMEKIFAPTSIAVIGASQKLGSIGNMVVQNLVDSKYSGKLFPINPTADQICGVKAYKSILDVPLPEIDMAVSVNYFFFPRFFFFLKVSLSLILSYTFPEKFFIQCAKETAGKKGVAHVVITNGFSEVGNTEAEQELVKVIKESGGRIIGPNVVGILLNGCCANASFAPYLPYKVSKKRGKSNKTTKL